MNSELGRVMDAISEYLPLVNTLLLGVFGFLALKFTSRKEHEQLVQRVTALEATMPNVAQMASDVAHMRGELKAQSERFNAIQRNIEMLVENELRGEDK